ncbi:MAG TPA: ABC transporter permease subunit [Trebonia sp.]|jgi:ABC-type transport system involved in multi-copper enzyme maturation permease subunit|nr:ABC transporter permease subunit [Trebonia sp.]
MATTTAVPGARHAALPSATGRAGLAGAVRSEWTKIRSVRSTYWTLGALIVVGIGLGAAICAATASNFSQPGNHFLFDATARSQTAFVELGQLVLMVLGALVITAEYSTGMIRTSLTSQPRRGTVYLGKGIVFTAMALVVSLVTSFIAFFVGQALLHSTGHAATLSDPNVMRAVVGSALYVGVIGLMAFAFGAIIRHTAGTIAAMVGILFILPLIVDVLPASWNDDINKWLPSSAGEALLSTIGRPGSNLYSAWPQFAITAAYTVILLIVGAVMFRKRDA